MTRKTFKVDEFRNQVNYMLANSTCSADQRRGMIAVLEQVLHDTDNYLGYRYLFAEELPPGTKPGIHHSATSYKLRFDNTDDTRVKYG